VRVVRRKPGAVLPLEASILSAAIEMAREGVTQFHGYSLAKQLRDDGTEHGLVAHGTLYKALGRLEKAGLLESVWEDPDASVLEGRPRRRLYTITAHGRVTVANLEQSAATRMRLDPGWSPS
jgi:DNA-binding PadR family transcriptional regulator